MGKQSKFRREEDINSLIRSELLPTFKIARDAILQFAKVERDLFTDMEEAESGNFIISGIQKYVTELDFTAFTFAVGQILYNQSYQSGNEDVNSGVTRKKARTLSAKTGETLYNGNIVTTLNDICRLGYGTEPTTEQKKKMATLIDTIDKKPVEIKFPNGDKLESKLCVTMDKYTREKDGAILYNLYLNPIFGSRIQNQFGELPQGIIADLDNACKGRKQRKTAAHYLLIRWLSAQDKRTPHTLTIDKIVAALRMEEYFKKDRGKADKQLISICNTMIDIGIINKYDVEYSISARKQRIAKVTFHLNQNYIRLPKGGGSTPPDKADETPKKREG